MHGTGGDPLFGQAGGVLARLRQVDIGQYHAVALAHAARAGQAHAAAAAHDQRARQVGAHRAVDVAAHGTLPTRASMPSAEAS